MLLQGSRPLGSMSLKISEREERRTLKGLVSQMWITLFEVAAGIAFSILLSKKIDLMLAHVTATISTVVVR